MSDAILSSSSGGSGDERSDGGDEGPTSPQGHSVGRLTPPDVDVDAGADVVAECDDGALVEDHGRMLLLDAEADAHASTHASTDTGATATGIGIGIGIATGIDIDAALTEGSGETDAALQDDHEKLQQQQQHLQEQPGELQHNLKKEEQEEQPGEQQQQQNLKKNPKQEKQQEEQEQEEEDPQKAKVADYTTAAGAKEAVMELLLKSTTNTTTTGTGTTATATTVTTTAGGTASTDNNIIAAPALSSSEAAAAATNYSMSTTGTDSRSGAASLSLRDAATAFGTYDSQALLAAGGVAGGGTGVAAGGGGAGSSSSSSPPLGTTTSELPADEDTSNPSSNKRQKLTAAGGTGAGEAAGGAAASSDLFPQAPPHQAPKLNVLPPPPQPQPQPQPPRRSSSSFPPSSFYARNGTTTNFQSHLNPNNRKKLPPPTAKNANRIGPLITKPAPNDVLFGRGGGTNVHLGNKIFRDLINAHRREYLKAKKNDKPGISMRIVQEVHAKYGGRFLKKADRHQDGWYEVDDRTSREKVSQALRQRAPELKKLIFKDEYNNEEI
eukprot:CAMPEP_0178653350 /NCGR_PEP_ID=MMETSP0698-20121128/23137_1 /TAXON_ID=265572 /ORGANISM="Extubocellulus spinifer, Strain CCMP396" /LENGTH=552 /DNA_ID=CAMNT_0020295119 /DNA_START=77 /DNA_END=1732 /DNA_ORIENTATION=+